MPDGKELTIEIPDTGYKLSKHQIAMKLGLEGQEELINYIDQQRNIISNMFMMNSPENLIKYNLNNIRKALNMNISNDQIMDILFYCPFKFPDPDEQENFHHIGPFSIK